MKDLQHTTQSDVVAQLMCLLELGTAAESGHEWPVYIGQEPDQPDNCLTVYDTPGISFGKLQNNGEDQEHYGVQIQVRAARLPVGKLKAQTVKYGLDQMEPRYQVELDNYAYTIYNMSPTSPINYLGLDLANSNRYLWTLNYQASLYLNS